MEEFLTDPLEVGLATFLLVGAFPCFAFVEDLKGRPLSKASYLHNLRTYNALIATTWIVTFFVCLLGSPGVAASLIVSHLTFLVGFFAGWAWALLIRKHVSIP